MTANAVTDDRKVVEKPTSEQVDTYSRRESELRVRFLKGILDTPGVLDLLQKALELVKGFINCNGQPEIPNWADKEKPIILHNPGGVIDPSKIVAEDIFGGEDSLDGEEFIRRGQALAGSMNACAFDFYSRKENWKYLPEGVDVIVFTQTIFRDSDGRRSVECLYRRGAGWNRDCRWLRYGFLRDCRVARLASSAKTLDAGH